MLHATVPPHCSHARRSKSSGIAYLHCSHHHIDTDTDTDTDTHKPLPFTLTRTRCLGFVCQRCSHGDLGTFAALDAGIMLQTLMLSAKSHGLATCAQGALATWGSPIRDEFDIPAGYKLLCGLSIGYASDDKVNSFNPGRQPISTSM